jgi:hypothetical protein
MRLMEETRDACGGVHVPVHDVNSLSTADPRVAAPSAQNRRL